jgi:hypothetical protein
MPIARSKPPVPPNTSLLFGHNAMALLPHRASYRRNIRLRVGQRAYSDRLLANAIVIGKAFLRVAAVVRRTQSGIIAAYLSYILAFAIAVLVLYPSIRHW